MSRITTVRPRPISVLSLSLGISASLLVPATLSAQGLVFLRAPANSVIYETDEITYANGTDYSIEVLYGRPGTPDENLVRLGSLLPPNTGALRGGAMALPGYHVGDRVRLLVRVWRNQRRTIKTYDAATVRGSAPAFEYGPITVEEGTPFDTLPLLDGLQNIYLHEPAQPSQLQGHLQPVFESRTAIGFGYRNDFLGVSASGRTAFVRSDNYSQSPFGYTYDDAYHASRGLTETFRTFASHSRFNPFGGPGPNPPGSTETPQWTVTGFTADARHAVGNRNDQGTTNAFWLGNAQPVLLNLTGVAGVSGDGQYSFGWNPSGALVRLHRTSQASHPVLPAVPATTTVSILGVSHIGHVALLKVSANGASQYHLWQEATGLTPWVTDPLLTPTHLAPNGLVVAGTVAEPGGTYAAFWSATRGVVRVGPANQDSLITGISFDGSTLAGTVRSRTQFPTSDFLIWTANGGAHRLADLLPELQSGKLQIGALYGLSHDGRVVGFLSAEADWMIPTRGYLAGFTLPGETFRATIETSETGGRQISFHARKGFHYQVQTSGFPLAWTPLGPGFIGQGRWVELPLDLGVDASLIRVEAKPD